MKKTARKRFLPQLEELEGRLTPATIDLNVAPLSSGSGLLNGGLYLGVAAGSPEINNDNQAAKTNFISQDVQFGAVGAIDTVFSARNTQGTTEFWFEGNVINNTGGQWIGFALFLGYGTGTAFSQAPILAGEGLDFDQPSADPTPENQGGGNLFQTLQHDHSVIIFTNGSQNNTQQRAYFFHIDLPDFDPAQVAEQFAIREQATLNGEPVVDANGQPVMAIVGYQFTVRWVPIVAGGAGGGGQLPVASNDQYSVSHNSQLSVGVPGVLANDFDPEDEPLTAVLASAPTYASQFTLNTDGSFTYAPTTGWTGTERFSYFAFDGLGYSSEAIVTIHVTNTPPTIDDVTMFIDENSDLEMPVGLVEATDPDNDLLSYTIIGGDPHGAFAINSSTGHITVAGPLDYETQASYLLTVQVTDNGGLSATAEVTININNINETPTANHDEFTIHHGTELYVVSSPILTSNDSDPDGDALTAELVSGPTSGTLEYWNAWGEGTFLYTPVAGFVGEVTFTYRVFDGIEYSNTATVTIHVTNAPPVTDHDEFTMHHSTELYVVSSPILTSNDSDPNGDALIGELVSGPTSGTLEYWDAWGPGTFLYTPVAGFVGEVTFSYRLFDGAEYSNTSTVTIHVTNEAPEAEHDEFTMHQGTELYAISPPILLSNDSDPDGDALIAELLTGPTSGTLEYWDGWGPGTFLYTPSVGFVGEDTFTYRVFDGAAYSDPATVTIIVTNAAPQFAAPEYAFALDENSPAYTFLGQVAAADPDGDAIIYSIVSGDPEGVFTIDPNTGLIHAIDALDHEDQAVYWLIVQASDNAGWSDTAEVAITVNDINEAPSVAITNSPSAAEEGSLASFTATGSDPDAGTNLTYSWTASIGGSTVATGSAAEFSFTPADDGTYEVTVTVSDGELSDSDSFELIVANVAPELTLTGASTVNEGTTYGLSVTWTDPGDDTVVSASVNWGDGTQQSVAVEDLDDLTHVYDTPGTYYIAVSITDEDGTFWADTKETVVHNVAPVLSLNVTYGAGRWVTLSGQVQDTHPGGLTVTFTGPVNNYTTTNADGTFSLTVEASGLGAIQAVTTDAWGADSNTASFTLTSNVPTITEFCARQENNPNVNLWVFWGYINDECKEGLTVTLGGLTSILNAANRTVTTNADGYFEIAFELAAGEDGTATADVADWWGISAEMAECFVNS